MATRIAQAKGEKSNPQKSDAHKDTEDAGTKPGKLNNFTRTPTTPNLVAVRSVFEIKNLTLFFLYFLCLFFIGFLCVFPSSNGSDNFHGVYVKFRDMRKYFLGLFFKHNYILAV
jgi:hypothetical protein